MSQTGELFYGFDMVYSKHQPIIKLEGENSYSLASIENSESSWEDYREKELLKSNLQPVFENTPFFKNKALLVKNSSNETIGYCQYFYEFSDWRYGFMFYINVLYLRKDQSTKQRIEMAKLFMKKLLKDKEGVKITALRLIIKK